MNRSTEVALRIRKAECREPTLKTLLHQALTTWYDVSISAGAIAMSSALPTAELLPTA